MKQTNERKDKRMQKQTDGKIKRNEKEQLLNKTFKKQHRKKNVVI